MYKTRVLLYVEVDHYGSPESAMRMVTSQFTRIDFPAARKVNVVSVISNYVLHDKPSEEFYLTQLTFNFVRK